MAPAIDFWQTSPPTTILYLITNSLRRSNWSLSVWKKEIPHGIVDLYGPHLSFFFSCVCTGVRVCVSHTSGNSRRYTDKPDGELCRKHVQGDSPHVGREWDFSFSIKNLTMTLCWDTSDQSASLKTVININKSSPPCTFCYLRDEAVLLLTVK